MGGQNPYIGETEVVMPKQKYTMTFLPMNKTVEVDPASWGECHDGLEGSVLHIALNNGIEIDHACGGVCACSTCHVLVREGMEASNGASDDEEDMLDSAPGLTPQSRLSCQTVPDGTKNVVIEIPDWNRNLAREPH